MGNRIVRFDGLSFKQNKDVNQKFGVDHWQVTAQVSAYKTTMQYHTELETLKSI